MGIPELEVKGRIREEPGKSRKMRKNHEKS
jgi:hypothetical protein